MNIPQPFPYQGSKRKIAPAIMALLPDNTAALIEPFAGSGAVSIATAHDRKAQRFILNDVNAPLVALWEKIVNQPEAIALQYEELWKAQQGREKEYYFYIRDEFNRTHGPHYLLYLLARCVKAAIRYNSRGEFNQSPDNRRKGMRPRTMTENILRTSQLLRGKTAISALDYREVLNNVQPLDVVYMDPPYQGVCKKQDPRYLQSLAFETLVAALQDLNARNVSYIVSYDGRTGSKTHGRSLPETLGLRHLEIDAGRSTQDTLLGRDGVTYESLYLSPVLCARLENKSAELRQLAFGF